ncbi:hypothetical protein niasHT_013188 [Heterodera trifolii]|uniref:Uncharacterized protein n=1 Tax=Heterodera trifolii TaxID=157864 RepID=A0ABD2KVN5_9BILA
MLFRRPPPPPPPLGQLHAAAEAPRAGFKRETESVERVRGSTTDGRVNRCPLLGRGVAHLSPLPAPRGSLSPLFFFSANYPPNPRPPTNRGGGDDPNLSVAGRQLSVPSRASECKAVVPPALLPPGRSSATAARALWSLLSVGGVIHSVSHCPPKYLRNRRKGRAATRQMDKRMGGG